MSSEVITRTDLTNILNEVLPSGVSLKIASVANTISRSAGNYRGITAPTVDGYTFLCWFNVVSSGWVSSLTIENVTNTTTNVWNTITSGSGQGNFIAYALYVKD